MIGRVVQNFEIVRELGKGGMGRVYEARDHMLDRRVAIKVLHPTFGEDPERIERFKKEAKALGRLRHPGITSVHSFFQEGAEFFLVMELVEGQALDEVAARFPELPWQQAVQWVGEILDGLEHAHQNGVVHRDVKPGNCLITDEGEVKITDFGIAQMVGGTRLTRLGAAIGTPEYMSPEQIEGKLVDHRTDLYSTGIVLYQLVTGRVPFSAQSDYELLRAQVEALPPPPSSVKAQLPPWLERVILRALAKAPEDRFDTAAEFAAALRRPATESLGPSAVNTEVDAIPKPVGAGRIDGFSPTTPLPPSDAQLPTTVRVDTPPYARAQSAVAPTPPDPPESRRASRRWPLFAGIFLVLALGAGMMTWFPPSDSAPTANSEPAPETTIEVPPSEEAPKARNAAELSPPPLTEEEAEPTSNEEVTPVAQAPPPPPVVQATPPPPPPPPPKHPPKTAAETARALEGVVRQLRTPMRELHARRKEFPVVRRDIGRLEGIFEDLEDNLEDFLDDLPDADYGDLEDTEDEVRKMVKRGEELEAKVYRAHFDAQAERAWKKIRPQLQALEWLLSTWGRDD